MLFGLGSNKDFRGFSLTATLLPLCPLSAQGVITSSKLCHLSITYHTVHLVQSSHEIIGLMTCKPLLEATFLTAKIHLLNQTLDPRWLYQGNLQDKSLRYGPLETFLPCIAAQVQEPTGKVSLGFK
jgi:hypothetical protein